MEVCEELKGIDYFDKDNQYLFAIGKGDGLYGKKKSFSNPLQHNLYLSASRRNAEDYSG